MRRVLAVIMAVLLFVASTMSLTSCWIGGDYTHKPGAGTVAGEAQPVPESSSTTSSPDTSSAQPQAPADAGNDDDESDIFGD